MAEKGTDITLNKLMGYNENPSGRMMNESPDCENVVGEGYSGFSVWRGRQHFFRGGLDIGENTHVYSHKFPDGHPSLLIFMDGKIGVVETGILYDVTGGLTFDTDKRNPISMTYYSRNRYVCGADYRRSQPWYWDGNIDRDAVAIETSHNPRVLCEFGGRLWGLGYEDYPLYAWYSQILDTDEVPNFTGAGAMEFRDGHASILVGMKVLNRNMALVWGDRGLWAMKFSDTFPYFYAQIIDKDCDCISHNSIVYVPGQGFFWQGRNNLWSLIGADVIDIGLSESTDDAGRKTPRIYDLLQARPGNSLYMASAIWHRKRNGIYFCWPTKEAHPAQTEYYFKGIFYRLADRTFWPIGYGVESMTEWEYNNETVILGSNRAGGVCIVDWNIATDFDDFIEWYWYSDWLSKATGKYKFTRAYLERGIGETPYVAANFWKDYEKTAVEALFDVGREYDAQADWPSWDPGGPDDPGAPPDATAVCEARIGLTGRRLKVKLSNKYNGVTYQGPKVPMRTLTLMVREA